MSVELARRAISCRNWVWMPDLILMPIPETLPDLDNPATMGCLLRMVRDMWGDPLASTAARREDEWCVNVCKDDTYHSFRGRSEAEALVFALEMSAQN